MTSRLPPQCLSCEHWVSPLGSGDEADEPVQVCAAFPDGIPEAIWWNRTDHRRAYKGDHGVRWEPRADAEFPDWALQL